MVTASWPDKSSFAIVDPVGFQLAGRDHIKHAVNYSLESEAMVLDRVDMLRIIDRLGRIEPIAC